MLKYLDYIKTIVYNFIMVSNMPIEYLTLKDAGGYLGVSKTWIWRAVKSGQIKVYQDPRDKRKKLVKKGDLEKYRQLRPIL
jgi:excisionase family DNA binding protein